MRRILRSASGLPRRVLLLVAVFLLVTGVALAIPAFGAPDSSESAGAPKALLPDDLPTVDVTTTLPAESAESAAANPVGEVSTTTAPGDSVPVLTRENEPAATTTIEPGRGVPSEEQSIESLALELENPGTPDPAIESDFWRLLSLGIALLGLALGLLWFKLFLDDRANHPGHTAMKRPDNRAEGRK